MKRLLSVCLSVALLVIFFTISISAETYSVIYVNALGNSENDGQTAQTPVQTLSQAYEKVSNNGVIVIMGDITQSSMIFPEKSVVLTGQYQSNNYHGRIIGNATAKTIYEFTAATTMDHLVINNPYSAGLEFFSGPSLTFGEGMEFQSYGSKITPTSVNGGAPAYLNGNRIAVRLGSSSSDCVSAVFTMKSGTLSWIAAGNNRSKTVETATIHLSNGASVTDFIQGSGTAGSRVDNLSLHAEGATIPRICIAGHGSAILGNADITLTNCNIGTIFHARPENATGTITGNTTVQLCGGKLYEINGNLPDQNRLGEISLILDGLTEEEGMTVLGNFSGWNHITVTGHSSLYLPEAYQGPSGEDFSVSDESSVMLSSEKNYTVPDHVGNGSVTLGFKRADYEVRKLTTVQMDTSKANNVQGTAIHDNYTVILSHPGVASIVELSDDGTSTLLDTIHLGSYNTGDPEAGAANHVNQCMFGAEKWDENDPLPLLYVTTGNSIGYSNDGSGYWARCAVERLTVDENGSWSAQTVQVICFNDQGFCPANNASGLTLCSDGQKRLLYKDVDGFKNINNYQKVSFGWPAFFVDYQPTSISQGKLYIFGARYRTTVAQEEVAKTQFGITSYATDNNYIITEFQLPALPEQLPESSSYALNHPVILTPNDIIGQFEAPFDVYSTQGGSMYNGRIYYSFGFGGSARGKADAIRIYDVSEEKQLKALDLSTSAFAAFEPECCCFYQGKLALSLQNRDIWIFDYIKGLD